jgi:hypothetical protein
MSINITVNEVTTPSNSVVQRVSGSRDSDVYTVTVNGSSNGVIFGSDNTWFYDAKLDAGDNRFEIQGVDSTGAKGSIHVITIVFNSVSSERKEAANHLDAFGLEMNVSRIRGEKNLHLKNRLKDVLSHPGGVIYERMLNNVARALSFKVIDDAMTIAIGSTSSGFDVINKAVIWSNTKYIYIETPESQISGEVHKVGSSGVINTDFDIMDDTQISISTVDGVILTSEIDYIFNSDDNSIEILNNSFIGIDVAIDYIYTRKIDLDGKTIQDISDELILIKDSSGNSIFNVTIKSGAESYLASHLSQKNFTTMTVDTLVSFSWTKFRFFQLHEEDVWRSELNSDGTVYGTDLESWIDFIRQNASVTWKNVKLDRDGWISDNQVNWNTFEPHVLDNKVGVWSCVNPSHSTTYDVYGFKSNSGKCPFDGLDLVYSGVLPTEIRSGVGYGTDLKTSIVEGEF